MSNQQKVILIAGPTASGKTQLSLELAATLPVEIISVDSAMIYKTMDIGTGKPDISILEKIPHHLIDILDPKSSYSVAQFCQDTHHIIQAILARGKIPLLVGGTMMYFKGLMHGLAALPSSNEQVRTHLKIILQEKGLLAMHERLQQVDPIAAARIHPNDPQRILRALEIYEMTHKTMSQHLQEAVSNEFAYHTIRLALAPQSRELLHQRIEQRFQQMLALGFIEEVEHLHQRQDLNKHTPSMRSVGYRQIWQYLDGEFTYEEMTEKAIIATRQLAKRQFTWLRSFQEMHWFDSEGNDLCDVVTRFLNQQLND